MWKELLSTTFNGGFMLIRIQFCALLWPILQSIRNVAFPLYFLNFLKYHLLDTLYHLVEGS